MLMIWKISGEKKNKRKAVKWKNLGIDDFQNLEMRLTVCNKSCFIIFPRSLLLVDNLHTGSQSHNCQAHLSPVWGQCESGVSEPDWGQETRLSLIQEQGVFGVLSWGRATNQRPVLRLWTNQRLGLCHDPHTTHWPGNCQHQHHAQAQLTQWP